MSTTVHALRVLTTTREEVERLLVHPASLSGSFDPKRGTWGGEVVFSSQPNAIRARNEAGL